jgi:hypothetical protein
MELCLRKSLREFFLIRLPNHFDENKVSEWVAFLVQLILVGAFCSILLSVKKKNSFSYFLPPPKLYFFLFLLKLIIIRLPCIIS